MKKQQGFTLIELMIVVAIVGILAAIAIPAYKDYTVRAKVSECAASLSACKASVTEFYNTQATMPANASAAGCSDSASQWCEGMAFDGTDQISITVKEETGVPSDCSLSLTAQTSGDEITGWDGGTTCEQKYVPANFR